MSKLKFFDVTDGGVNLYITLEKNVWHYLNVSRYSLKDVYWDIHKIFMK